jgi:gliding motility associated protien GldN
MKSLVVKSCLLVSFGVLLFADAEAQRTGRRRTTTPDPNTEPPAQQQTNNNAPVSGYNPYGNIPIVVDSSAVADTVVRKSLRNDNAFDKSSVNARTPLPYEHLRADDALYAEKVWRELDLREKMNQPFRYAAEGDNGSEIFVNILLRAVNTGQVTAFEDERFTTPRTAESITEMTQGSADTVPQVDPNDPSKVIRYVVTRSSFDPNTVTKIRIKEEWVFDRESSRMYCRILGIAPLKSQFFPDGRERPGSTPMFWVYYPDLRPILTKYEVYNPKNMGQSRMTWEELFESRMFSSYITKSTIENAANRTIRQYIKDPILALLEGENVKEKIFNFEQDLWSY